jgi:hypothetical protein
MNKKLLILIVIVLLSVIGGVVYVNAMSRAKAPVIPESPGMPLEEQSTTDRNLQGSIFDLIKMGRALNCKFSGTEPKSEGEIFILGNKMRGNFTMDNGTGTMVASHVVSDGEFMYMWGDAMDQGIKMSYSALDVEKAKTDTNLKALNDTYDYKCSDWAVDDSYFIAPSNVTYTDMTELQNMLQEDRTGIDMCNSCAVIPDETAKNECIAQFKCLK